MLAMEPEKMAMATSTTRWRDERIVPEDYEDIARIVAVAQKARSRM
jgi:hypothetical protein